MPTADPVSEPRLWHEQFMAEMAAQLVMIKGLRAQIRADTISIQDPYHGLARHLRLLPPLPEQETEPHAS